MLHESRQTSACCVSYVLLLYRSRFAKQPRLTSLGISSKKLTDKSFFQDQDKQQESFFVILLPVKYYDRLVATVR